MNNLLQNNPRKRFIAGATCPNCQVEDRLAIWQEATIEVVECVACGQRLPQKGENKPTERLANQQTIAIFQPK